MRKNRITAIALCVAFCGTLSLRAQEDAEIAQWILKKITTEESLLEKALLRQEGYTVDLLLSSKDFVPFFPETPNALRKDVSLNEALLIPFSDSPVGNTPSGGYLFRVKADGSDRLFYNLSGGGWSNNWFDPKTGAEIEINSFKFWDSKENDGLHVTLIQGIPPRLVFYSRDGSVLESTEFDLNSADVQAQIDDAIKEYSNEKPLIEKTSLNEFLNSKAPFWRPLGKAQHLNFRNQQQDPLEKERLNQNNLMTRAQAKQLLQSRLISNENSDSKDAPEGSQTSVKDHKATPINWLLILGGIIAIGGLITLVKRKK